MQFQDTLLYLFLKFLLFLHYFKFEILYIL
nr:MAG TPA: hypothetical protein [Caudoviricetes sp.]